MKKSLAFFVAYAVTLGTLQAQTSESPNPERPTQSVASQEASSEPVQSPDQARIAAVGSMHHLRVGQSGYCGRREFIPDYRYKKILVKGNEPVWIDISRKEGHGECKGDLTFTPTAGSIYVLRFASGGLSCLAQLFEIIDASKLVPRRIEVSKREVC